MKNTNLVFLFFLSSFFFACNQEPKNTTATDLPQDTNTKENALPKQELTAIHTVDTILLDGLAEEKTWEAAEWLPLDQTWVGLPPSKEDYQGRYKLAWSEDAIYLLAEIVDDTLIDIHPDGLEKYWDDDCLEVFIDEDASGGDHQYSHNAFAYHIALDGKVVDINPDTVFTYYQEHISSARTQNGKTSTWEVAVKIYSDAYVDGAENSPEKLFENKKIGFALAYCDNDHSPERENFMGSVFVPGVDKNLGWKDAGIFGHLTLGEAKK